MILFLDTETTGLPKSRNASPEVVDLWPRLVSVAWACGKREAAAEYIVRPDGFTVPLQASNVHGITTQKAEAEGLPLAEVFGILEDILGRCTVVACYNVAFDKNVLLSEAHRMGHARLIKKLEDVKWYCVMDRVQRHFGNKKYIKLEAAHSQLCGMTADYHNASEDVLATRDIMLALCSKKKT